MDFKAERSESNTGFMGTDHIGRATHEQRVRLTVGIAEVCEFSRHTGFSGGTEGFSLVDDAVAVTVKLDNTRTREPPAPSRFDRSTDSARRAVKIINALEVVSAGIIGITLAGAPCENQQSEYAYNQRFHGELLSLSNQSIDLRVRMIEPDRT